MLAFTRWVKKEYREHFVVKNVKKFPITIEI